MSEKKTVVVPVDVLEWAQQNIDCVEDEDERIRISAVLANYIASAPASTAQEPTYAELEEECRMLSERLKDADAKLAEYEAPTAQQLPEELDELLGKYWSLAYSEGKDGVSHGDDANEVLHKLRCLYRASTAQPDSEREALLIAGQRMANTMYNMAQRVGFVLTKDAADGLTELHQAWDKAYANRHSPTAPQDAQERTSCHHPYTGRGASYSCVYCAQPADKPEGKAEQPRNLFAEIKEGFDALAVARAEQDVSLIGEGNMVEQQAEPDQSLTEDQQHWFDRGVEFEKGRASVDLRKSPAQPQQGLTDEDLMQQWFKATSGYDVLVPEAICKFSRELLSRHKVSGEDKPSLADSTEWVDLLNAFASQPNFDTAAKLTEYADRAAAKKGKS
jgi:hypothetical protein